MSKITCGIRNVTMGKHRLISKNTFRWRGSIYKILWKEFALFSFAYFLLSFTYRYFLTDNLKRYFELGAQYCSQFNNLIPVAFVLGFYVNHVANRWWEKFKTLPWPGRMAMYVTAHLHGHDERARLMRRTIMRYMCLSYVMTMSSISPPVKKRFPNLSKMLDAGFMLPNEEQVINNIKTPYNKFFIPLVWASAVVTRARKEGRIKDDFAVKTLIDEINDYRTRSFHLFNFDWVTIPLVYTQVVTLAVYTFFLSCLMGRQYLENGHSGDMIFPFFTFLQFLFYMGWLKVAETMLNPFGEDDDDFDINYLIDRHLKVSYLVVDEMHNEHPDLIRDQYWDSIDFQLPYSEDSEPPTNDLLRGSAIDINVPERKNSIFASPLSRIEEEGSFGFTIGSFNTRQLRRTPSKASNTSKASYSFKPHNFIKALKRSVPLHKNNISERSMSMSEIHSNVLSPGQSISKESDVMEINQPYAQTEDEIFRMSLEDIKKDENKTLIEKDSLNSGKSSKSKPVPHGSPSKRKACAIRRNNTDSNLELERGKEGFRYFSNKFPGNSSRNRNSINQSIKEEEEEEEEEMMVAGSGEPGMFVDDMMQELRMMHKNDEARAIQASHASQAEIMNLFKNNINNTSNS